VGVDGSESASDSAAASAPRCRATVAPKLAPSSSSSPCVRVWK
jgi:hypothetical protein